MDEKLIKEHLRALARRSGLTLTNLREHPALWETLNLAGPDELRVYIVDHLAKLEGTREGLTLRQAYGLSPAGGVPSSLATRRTALAKQWGVSIDTIKRYERSAVDQLYLWMFPQASPTRADAGPGDFSGPIEGDKSESDLSNTLYRGEGMQRALSRMQVPGVGPVAPFGRDLWDEQVLAGLEAACDVAALRRRASEDARNNVAGSAADDEEDALRRLADQPAFAALHPDLGTPVDEGRWIMTRILKAADALRQERPSERPTSEWTAAQKAVLLWADALELGLHPAELFTRHAELLPGRGSAWSDAGAMRVRSVMWLRGNRRLDSAAEGIEAVYYAVVTALTQPSQGAPVPDDIVFDYEWTRITAATSSPERQLLVLLSHLAADVPVPLALLRLGWEPLPSPLRGVVRDRAALQAVMAGLARRGLAGSTEETVTCSAATQQRVRRALTRAEAGSAASITMRFVTAALPSDTQHHGSWPLWRQSEQHVRAAVEAAQASGRRLDDAAHMLDRLAVFLRVTQRLGEAITTSEEAVALAEGRGRPDLIEYGIYLGNLALALRSANRLVDALKVMDRSLEVTASSVGTEHEEYAGSLNIKGNLLGAMKRYGEAMQAHEEALAIIRRIAVARPVPEVIGTLVEVLNDSASDLLRHEAEDDSRRALALLDEAEARVERGEYGWTEIRFNRAEVLRLLGRLEEAEAILRDLVVFSEHAYGDPSLQLLAALANLAEVLGETGSSDYDAIFLRAHEVDDALQDEPDPDDPAADNGDEDGDGDEQGGG
jgi:tetratricopeptide (TPR) repeat protein